MLNISNRQKGYVFTSQLSLLMLTGHILYLLCAINGFSHPLILLRKMDNREGDGDDQNEE